MARKKALNNVLAGSFLVASVVMAVVISFVLSDAEFTRTTPYEIRVPLKQGAHGIEPGSFVTLGGQKIGKVTDVAFLFDEEGPLAPAVGVSVKIRVRAEVVLYENALVYVERPLLGALSNINIADAGTPDAAPYAGTSPRLEPGEWIPGRTASALMVQAGLPPEGFAGMFTKFDELTRVATQMVEEIRPHVKPTVDKVSETLENVRDMTASTRQRLPIWQDRIDSIMRNSDEAARKFGPLMDRADLLLGDVHASASTVGDIIEASAPKITQAVDDVAATTRHVREKSLRDLDEAFAKTKQSLDAFGETVAGLNTLARQETPNIRRMLANGRLASDQFKLLMTELRAQPWRALVRPSSKELEQQLIYDAARAYADAVSNLRSASETLESMAVPGALPDETHRRTLEQLTAELQAAFEQYKKAESQLLDQMIEGRP